jgi:CRP-like cAMP-binding protein
MFEQLFKHVSAKIAIGDHEKNVCRALFKPHTLHRKQFLIRQGEICRNLAFVEKGLLRSYTIDEKGGEHIVQFAPEGWWISDIYSFHTEEPCEYNIDALETTEMLVLNKQSWEQLLEQAPVFERYFRILTQNSLVAYQRRVARTLMRTAEEVYMEFLRIYPEIAQRVPQHNIASYLGITPESLSRIRRQIAARQRADTGKR